MVVLLVTLTSAPAALAADKDVLTTPKFQGVPKTGPREEAKLIADALIEPLGGAPTAPEAAAIAAVNHTVEVRLAADDEFRAFYGSTWSSNASARVEAADDKLFSNWGIDLVVKQIVTADTTDGTRDLCGAIWPEIRGEITEGIYDIAITFVKNPWSGPSAGCASPGYDRFIVGYQGPTADWQVTRHEMSHLYGLDDASGSVHPNDIMENPYSYPNSWCSHPDWEHYDTMTFNAGKYG